MILNPIHGIQAAPAVEIVPNPNAVPNFPIYVLEEEDEDDDDEESEEESEGRQNPVVEFCSFFLTKEGLNRLGQLMRPFVFSPPPANLNLPVQDPMPQKKLPVFKLRLLPDLVLCKIFNKFSWIELKELRLVCRYWEFLIHRSRLTEDKIVCQYNGTWTVTEFRKKSWNRIRKKFNPFSKVISNLPFNTLRVTRVYNIDWFNFDRWAFTQRISNFCFQLNQVKRIEFDATVIMSTAIAQNRLFDFWRQFFPLIHRVPMLQELVIFQNWILQPFPTPFRVFDDEIQSKFTRIFRKYKREWKMLASLTKFEYDLSLPQISEYLVMLKGIGNVCRVLVHVKILVNYEEVWLSNAGQVNLFNFIGIILKVNALTLKTFYLGSKREYKGTLPRIEGMGQPTASETFYAQFSGNPMFESLLNEIWDGKWAEFQLKSLEHLTFIFPIPVLPSTMIVSHLAPFLESCKNLKIVRIQPMVAIKNVPHVDSIFEKLAKKNTWSRWGQHYNPLLEAGIVFFPNEPGFNWEQTRNAAYHSFVDMEYNKVVRLNDGTQVSNKTVHWRNIYFDSLMESPILPALPALSILIISQDQRMCSLSQIISIGDDEMQTIINYGKSLKAMVLNCNLKSMTAFGFAGLYWHSFEEFVLGDQYSQEYIKEYQAHSILDLKYLKRLVLLGLRIGLKAKMQSVSHKYSNPKKSPVVVKQFSMGANGIPLIEPTACPKTDPSRYKKPSDKEIIKLFFSKANFDFCRITFESDYSMLPLAGRSYDFTRYLLRTKTSKDADIFNKLMSSHIWD